MDNIETFHNTEIVVAENVGFGVEADLFKCVQMNLTFAVMDKIEMFHYKKIVAAEAVGFRFQSDPVKSVPITIGFGYSGQH